MEDQNPTASEDNELFLALELRRISLEVQSMSREELEKRVIDLHRANNEMASSMRKASGTMQQWLEHVSSLAKMEWFSGSLGRLPLEDMKQTLESMFSRDADA